MKTLIKQAEIHNEGKQWTGDLLIDGNRIAAMSSPGTPHLKADDAELLEARGLYLFPGIIDDQVHFREPGLTHKAEIATESAAAVAGGVTSYMEMPNTKPPALTQELLEAKYSRAAEVSRANYSFYMGASNENLREVLKTDPRTVCGIKVFMGSSTGNMLVDKEETLQGIFSEAPALIATHNEYEPRIQERMARQEELCGPGADASCHPIIRDAEACYRSSSQAVGLAHKYGADLHVLHVSTARELELFAAGPVEGKAITAEACVHHLWFDDRAYARLGNFVKWNPAIKTEADKNALRQGLKAGKLDVVATDHAPHTREEKMQAYPHGPSGGPMVQHSLQAMLELSAKGLFTREEIVEKMCHNPAKRFKIAQRGFLREGYYADLVLVRPHVHFEVNRSNLLYKCGWSPLEGERFGHEVAYTFVNGEAVFANGLLHTGHAGMRLAFER